MMVLAMVFGILPVMKASAAPVTADYSLYFDSENGILHENDISGAVATFSDGSITCEEGILTLHNADFTTTAGKALILDQDTEIVLVGNSTLKSGSVSESTGNAEAYGIYANDGDGPKITFSGSGNLNVTGGDATCTSGGFAESDGMYARDVIFSGSGNLTFTGGNADGHAGMGYSTGIRAYSLTLNSGIVKGAGQNAAGDNGHNGYGVNMYDDSGFLEMTGGTLNAEGTIGMDLGGSGYGADLRQSGGTINAKGTSDGIFTAGEITVSGGTLNATGAESGGDGIYLVTKLEARGNGKIRVTGGPAVESCDSFVGDAVGSAVYQDTGTLSPAEYRESEFYVGENEAKTLEITKYTGTGFIITLDAGIGYGSLSKYSLKTDDTGKLSETLPTPTSPYGIFTGWYNAAEGGTQITDSFVFSDNTTLYAHWRQRGGSGSSSGGSGGENSGGVGVSKGPEGNTPIASAGSWHENEDGSWGFTLTSGGEKKSGWLYTGNSWYHFDENGKMTTGWIQGSDGWYRTNTEKGPDEGKLLHGWHQDTDGNWYYFDLTTGRMLIGWLKSPASGKWYYLNTSTMAESGIPNGAMLSGCRTPDGYDLNTDGSLAE